MRTRALLILFASQFLAATSFQQIVGYKSRARQNLSTVFESKDDEIAELEEKLKRLKEEKVGEAIVAETIGSEEDVGEVPLDMFLTEQWKESEANKEASSGGGFTNVLYGIGAALVVVLFSQIPIGQEDLSKYSVGSTPAVEQIDLGDLNRARRAGDL